MSEIRRINHNDNNYDEIDAMGAQIMGEFDALAQRVRDEGIYSTQTSFGQNEKKVEFYEDLYQRILDRKNQRSHVSQDVHDPSYRVVRNRPESIAPRVSPVRYLLNIPDGEDTKEFIKALPYSLREQLGSDLKTFYEGLKTASSSIYEQTSTVQRRIVATMTIAGILATGVVMNEEGNHRELAAPSDGIGLVYERTSSATVVQLGDLANQDIEKSVDDVANVLQVDDKEQSEIKVKGNELILPVDISEDEILAAFIAWQAQETDHDRQEPTTTISAPETTVPQNVDPEVLNDEEYIKWLVDQVKPTAEGYKAYDVDTSREDAFKDELSGQRIKPTAFVGHWTAGTYRNGVDQFISSIKNREGNCCSVMYFMDREGKTYRLTDSWEKTAHARGANSFTQGVEIEADNLRGKNEYTPKQMENFLYLAYRFMEANDIPIQRDRLLGHQEVDKEYGRGGKIDMPPELVDQLFPKLKQLDKELKGSETKEPKTGNEAGLTDKSLAIIDNLNLTDKQKDFLRTMLPAIRDVYKDGAHINPAVVLAQTSLETGFGQSKLSSEANNYFGMKAGKSWTGEVYVVDTKEEYKPGEVVTIKDSFRKYDNPVDSVRDYVEKIENSEHYADAVINYKDAQSYVNGLFNEVDDKGNIIKEQGEPGVLSYGTDRGYEEKVMSLISSRHYMDLMRAEGIDPMTGAFDKSDKDAKNRKDNTQGTQDKARANDDGQPTTTSVIENPASDNQKEGSKEIEYTYFDEDATRNIYQPYFKDDAEGLDKWIASLPTKEIDGQIKFGVSVKNTPDNPSNSKDDMKKDEAKSSEKASEKDTKKDDKKKDTEENLKRDPKRDSEKASKDSSKEGK